MASIEELFNGEIGEKENNKLKNKNVIEKEKTASTDVLSPQFIPQPTIVEKVNPAEVVNSVIGDYSQLSKEELLIILRADRYLSSVHKNVSDKVVSEIQRDTQEIPCEPVEASVTVPKQAVPNTQLKRGVKVNWKAYLGWWVAAFLGTALFVVVLSIIIGR